MMLILSRRPGESVVFPELGITIELIRVKGQGARLAIDAPQSIRILRDELLDREPSSTKASDPAGSGDLVSHSSRPLQPESADDFDHLDIEEVQDQVGVVRLALFLCQNQLKFDNHVFAQDTLDSAINAMEKLESVLAEHPDWKTASDEQQVFDLETPNGQDTCDTDSRLGQPTQEFESPAEAVPVKAPTAVKEPASPYQIGDSLPWNFESEPFTQETESHLSACAPSWKS